MIWVNLHRGCRQPPAPPRALSRADHQERANAIQADLVLHLQRRCRALPLARASWELDRAEGSRVHSLLVISRRAVACSLLPRMIPLGVQIAAMIHPLQSSR